MHAGHAVAAAYALMLRFHGLGVRHVSSGKAVICRRHDRTILLRHGRSRYGHLTASRLASCVLFDTGRASVTGRAVGHAGSTGRVIARGNDHAQRSAAQPPARGVPFQLVLQGQVVDMGQVTVIRVRRSGPDESSRESDSRDSRGE